MEEFNILVEALNKANKAGVFNLQEAESIIKCIVAVQVKLKPEDKKKA